MTSARFELGQKEKHTVEVDYSALTGRIKVLVDGKELTDAHHFWLGAKKYNFEVGDAEKHKAELRLATYGHKVELVVDGKPTGSV